MSVALSSILSIQDFCQLDAISKRAFYQEANEEQKVDVVRQLNDLGMKPKAPSFSGPSIVSNFMDITTKYDTILDFLKELRQTNRLLTTEEFQPLSTKKWVTKAKISRILGCDHLIKKIKENHSRYIKVPLKIAVVDDTESLIVTGWEANNHYDISLEGVKIFAEEIKSAKRKLSRDEIDELIQIIAEANFIDLCPENIVVAEDGVYFVDNELKSFAGSICWEKMYRFEDLINEDDKPYFYAKVEEKMNEPKEPQECNGYNELMKILAWLNELPESTKDKNEVEELKMKILALEYIGDKKVGNNWLNPNTFLFNLRS